MIQEILSNYLVRYSFQTGIEFKLVRYSSAKELLESEEPYHILFLDIMLGNNIHGVDVGRELRKCGNNALFILLTSRTDCFQQGYSANVFRYLVKPLGYDEFSSVMKETLDHFISNKMKLGITYSKHKTYVDIKDIVAVESIERKRFVWTKVAKIQTTMSMKEIWDKLSENLFFAKPNQSFIINTEKIYSLDKRKVVMIPVPYADKELSIKISNKKTYEEISLTLSNYLER